MAGFLSATNKKNRWFIVTFRKEFAELIVQNLDKVNSWFEEKTKNKTIPFYSSFDIRDSGHKISCIDANVFPAGFNNICDNDQQTTIELIKKYLKEHYPSCKKILLLAEEHTKNFYYWDNLAVIQSLIESAGYKVLICVPGLAITSPQKIQSASGRTLSIHLLEKEQGDLVISNNDFSVAYDNLNKDLKYNPCIEMGWASRRKHSFFIEYNQIAKEFASLLGINPWCLQVATKFFSPFDLDSPASLKLLKKEASEFLKTLKDNHPDNYKEDPYLFLKNNSGTYGLGITTINDADELDHLNYKTRKKMKASKGGSKIKELIIQEGIPTSLKDDTQKSSVEPVIYMLGSELTGGFLRGHEQQGYKANLNSPGAVYRTLCVSDLEIEVRGHVMENVYGWIAKLGVLALIAEIEKRSLDFRGYKN